jgi:hypothetical protein
MVSALAYLEPAEVQRARAKGRRVLRQGDVFAVETTASHDTREPLQLGRHHWDPQTHTLTHDDPDNPHAELHLPFPVRFVRQHALVMGRGGGRGFAD